MSLEKEAPEKDYQRIASAIDFLVANGQQSPSLDALAKHCHLSPFHLQRLFQRWAGTTPKRFQQVLTVNRAKPLLRQQHSIEAVSHELGLSSPSRLYDHFIQLEAMTPGEYSQLGEKLVIHYGTYNSPFGQILLARTARGICSLTFIENADSLQSEIEQLQAEWPKATFMADDGTGQPLCDQLFALPSARQQPISLLVKGTNFQINVWKALLTIPEGQFTSYGTLATQLGKTGAARAVGSAVGANPISFLIPCHKVIRQCGALGGYHWGLTRKRAILAWEQLQLSPEEGTTHDD